MKKIAVLGANGTVGQHIVPALVAAGHTVFAASRSGKTVEGVTGVAVDYDSPASFDTLFSAVDVAYVMLPTGYVDIETKLLPVVALAAEHGVKVVFQSVFGVDADDSIPYRKVELALEASGTPYVILRPNWFMDNFHSFWLAGIQHGELALPAGDAQTSFIDARDIADSAVAALTNDRFDGKAFNLTGGEALSYAEAIKLISDAIDKPVTYVANSAAAFTNGLINVGVPADYAHFLAAIFEPVAAGYTAAISGDVLQLTGHQPRRFADYLATNAARF
ncbi:SDR family oxidoreductase [Aestuariibacter sp. GS-14]|uniref:SDR family oxidoreductase n=1 Tax=Aestuariibacter sp. GS-14 TaxID=2590670 RepID=UPI001C63B8C1|nr:SDR family oxidoreductase [Aestuariibacter sp. GS-14]